LDLGMWLSPYTRLMLAATDVRELEIGYESDVLIRSITFTVAAGEIMAIMGGSGSGKSTLLKYLIGLREVEKRGNHLSGSKLCKSCPGRTGGNSNKLWRSIPEQRIMEWLDTRGKCCAALGTIHPLRYYLIVLGNRGHSRLWGELVGHTTDRVSEHAPCSVLANRCFARSHSRKEAWRRATCAVGAGFSSAPVLL